MDKIIEQAARNGKVQVSKMCNSPVNLGKTPALVLVEQLRKLGYEIVKVSQ